MKFSLTLIILLYILLTGVSALETYSYLYTRSNPQVPFTIQDFEDVKINISKPLKVLIHGWLGSMFYTIYADMKDELLRKEDCNVIILDWSKNIVELVKSAMNTKRVGKVLGETLYYLYNDYDLIHLIGFGLGAHIAGFAAKVIQNYSEDKSGNTTNETSLNQITQNKTISNTTSSNTYTMNRIGRISGLDPTLPQFNGSSPADRLHKNDATIVDVYHCDGYRFAFGDPIGTIDFFPNGGVAPMPSCNDDDYPLSILFYKPVEDALCTHLKVREYFAYSIKRNDIIATKCDSWENYKRGLCDGNEKAAFGYYVSPESHGTFAVDVIAYMYSRNNPNVPLPVLNENEIDRAKPVKLIVHGYLETASTQIYEEMKNEYLKREDCYFVIFDWSKNACEYSSMVVYTKVVGKFLGGQIYYLYSSYEHIHMIGIGLGAHLAGFAAKEILRQSNHQRRIGRITALDPAFPRFDGVSRSERLDKDDARMVDVYHCDGNKLGYNDPLGRVDIYINGGIGPQPGCKNATKTYVDFLQEGFEAVACSSIVCRNYFLNSINNNDTFAKKCNSSKKFNLGLCDENEQILFGENLNLETIGIYYINITILNYIVTYSSFI